MRSGSARGPACLFASVRIGTPSTRGRGRRATAGPQREYRVLHDAFLAARHPPPVTPPHLQSRSNPSTRSRSSMPFAALCRVACTSPAAYSDVEVVLPVAAEAAGAGGPALIASSTACASGTSRRVWCARCALSASPCARDVAAPCDHVHSLVARVSSRAPLVGLRYVRRSIGTEKESGCTGQEPQPKMCVQSSISVCAES